MLIDSSITSPAATSLIDSSTEGIKRLKFFFFAWNEPPSTNRTYRLPKRVWNLFHSRTVWTKSCAMSSRLSLLVQGGWPKWPPVVPSNLVHSVFLWSSSLGRSCRSKPTFLWSLTGRCVLVLNLDTETWANRMEMKWKWNFSFQNSHGIILEGSLVTQEWHLYRQKNKN